MTVLAVRSSRTGPFFSHFVAHEGSVRFGIYLRAGRFPVLAFALSFAFSFAIVEAPGLQLSVSFVQLLLKCGLLLGSGSWAPTC